ncbi:MAG TPA: tetratricopeptide repeat protein, partial [Candidatus Bathyarchaeia archaeon]|nr:tetratricopeptide repeat protein [Candidatus Bathyarchaeia archaeon]
VLGDSADHPRFIETIPRRGYRFIAPVTSPDSSTATEAVASSKEKEAPQNWLRWGGLAISALVLAALFVGLISYRLRQRVLESRAPQIQSLAVIPLTNLSDDPGQEYFSDGMTDALITELAQIGSIRVISRTSSMQYKQTRKSLPEIARELQVDGIVEGTVQRSGDRVRISAQLIQGPTDKHLWANSYERDLRDVFLLERDVAGDIARQVQARLNSDKRPPPAQPRPVNPAALEAYLQGNVHIHKFSRGSGDEELRLASVFFQQAIDAEPDFAPAYVGLSKARGGTLRSSSEDVDIAKRAAERAAELDPNFSDAWSALADIKCDFWDWAGAEQDYRRALALNPNDGEAHEHLGWLLDALGRLDEGWKEAEMAQQVDPNQDHLEPALDNRHEYDRIIQHIRPMLEADPDNGYLHYELYEGYVGKGMYKEAIQHLEECWVRFGFPQLAARMREAFAASGYKSAMRTYAEGLERLHVAKQVFAPMNLAGAYSAAGDKDRGFYWLEQGYQSRGRGGAGMSMVFVNRDPGIEPLRSDPRYKDLLRRIGLPQ